MLRWPKERSCTLGVHLHRLAWLANRHTALGMLERSTASVASLRVSMHQELLYTTRHQTTHDGARTRVKTLPRLAVNMSRTLKGHLSNAMVDHSLTPHRYLQQLRLRGGACSLKILGRNDKAQYLPFALEERHAAISAIRECMLNTPIVPS